MSAEDSRLEFILTQHPTAPADDPIQVAADILTCISSEPIDAGEARLLLVDLAKKWGIVVPEAHLRDKARWCAEMWAIRAQDDSGDGDPLAVHLKSQASGRYAMVPWPWEALTAASRSLMPGSVTVVCGTPGASKSWFALSCIRHWTANGINSAVLMLEETTKWHMQRALAQCVGDPNLLYPEWIKAHPDEAMALWERHRDDLAIVRSHLVCEAAWTLEQCAQWVEAQCDAGRRVLIIDPISLADPGSERSWDADRKFMARAQKAIGKAGASLVLITHPTKSKVPGPPSLDHLAGGAAYQRACASALWVTGVDEPEEVPVVAHDGKYSRVVPHKVIRILKSRNGIGTGKGIAYAFRDLQFEEQGVLVGKSAKPAPAESARGAKLRRQPDASEDLFGV